MIENYDPRYFILGLIPEYRQGYIDLKVKWLIRTLSLKASDWPLDSVKIIQKMKATQKIPFTYGPGNVPNRCDAIAQYYPEEGINVLLYNSTKFHYPYNTSNDRRFNFTLAHEIGHIVLEHLIIPRSAKSKDEIFIEELEANEFAGRFLMPKDMILSCNFLSIEAVSQYFIVSDQAVWKRLNHLKRLDLLNSLPKPVCNCCNNSSISPIAEYCCICGSNLLGCSQGIGAINYSDGFITDGDGMVMHCPSCSKKTSPDDGLFCTSCDTYLYNICTGSFSTDCLHINPSNARYCECCGKETVFYISKYLAPWNHARERFLGVLVAEDALAYALSYDT